MGYSYCEGKLCCDVCGDYGQVRKYKCPFGYCPAIALCPKCKREHPEYTSKEGHRAHDCEKHSQEYHRQEEDKAAIINAGGVVRCAALGHGQSVKVIFQGQHDEQAYLMSQATYDAIPLMVNATPDDYRKHGEVTPAQSLDIYQPV